MNVKAVIDHATLIAGLVFLLLPIALILFSSSHDSSTLVRESLQLSWGDHFIENYRRVLGFQAGISDQVTPLAMMRNSLIVAVSVATMTTVFSLLAAYAIVFFRLRYATFIFWLVFTTLLFPLEARFTTTFQTASTLGLINTHAGIILPVLSLALGTFFFRQFFLGLPEELMEAAQLDGAGPVKFLADFIVPLSRAPAGAIFVISFMVGWNQYLWPLMVSTDDSLYTLVRGIRLIGQASGPGMAMIVITLLPPFLLVLVFQRWCFRALKIGHSTDRSQ